MIVRRFIVQTGMSLQGRRSPLNIAVESGRVIDSRIDLEEEDAIVPSPYLYYKEYANLGISLNP